MVDRSAEHWYPTAAYLYVLHLDDLALAWEYLRRNPDYRLDWLRCHRRPQAAQQAAHRWGLRLLEDPALDAREAHPAWLPGHTAVVQLYPDEDPPSDAVVFAFWRIPGHKQLIHDGKRLVLAARWPGRSLRFALAPGLEDGMAVAYAMRASATTSPRGLAFGMALAAQADAGRAAGTAHLADARRRPGGCVLARGGHGFVRRGCRGRLVRRWRPALEGAPLGAAWRCVDARRISATSTTPAA